jgi:hypothetical protein
MAAIAHVASDGIRWALTQHNSSVGYLGVPTSPRDNQYIVFGSHQNGSASADITSVFYKTAGGIAVPLTEHVSYLAYSDEILKLWGAPLRWWETDLKGWLEYTDTTIVPKVCYCLLENVAQNGELQDTDTLTTSNGGSSTIAMASSDDIVVCLGKVVGGSGDYDPTGGGVERWDSYDSGDNNSFAIWTDQTQSGGTNTWGWGPDPISRTTMLIAISLYAEVGPAPRVLRHTRRHRHPVVGGLGFSGGLAP